VIIATTLFHFILILSFFASKKEYKTTHEDNWSGIICQAHQI
jgi:hypothetical protein